MGDYQLIAVEGPRQANPGARVAELEKAKITTVEWELNNSGSMQFDLPTRDTKSSWTELIKYEYQVWRNDSLIWWGIPLTRRANADTLTVACKGLWEYLKYRFIHATKTYSQSDQHTIGWDLVYYAQTAFEGGDLNIDSSGFLGSGVLRDRTYLQDEHGNIAELVANLTQVINGFDFDIAIYGDGRREWTPYYPSKGTNRADLVLEFTDSGARAIVGFEMGEDGTRMANYVTATGAGMGPDKLEQSYVDTVARDSLVLLQDVVSDTNVLEAANLFDKARGQVEARKSPVKLPQLTVEHTTKIPTIGVIQTGDTLPVRISYGPFNYSGSFRVMKITLNPDTDQMKLDLEVVPGTVVAIVYNGNLYGQGAYV